MKEGHNNKILILVAVLILIAFGAYMFFFDNTDTSDETLTVEVGATTGKEISDLLDSLKKINLAGSIFTNPTFIGLNNIGLQIVPFPAGRTNPFAPIGL